MIAKTNEELVKVLNALATELEKQNDHIREVLNACIEQRQPREGNIGAPASFTVAAVLRDIADQVQNAGEEDFDLKATICLNEGKATLAIDTKDCTVEQLFCEVCEIDNPELIECEVV